MKARIQKAVLFSGAMLYLLTAASFPAFNNSVSTVISGDNRISTLNNGVQTQSDPFPICPQCTSMIGH